MAAAAILDFVDHDHLIRHRPFLIGDPLKLSPYVEWFFEIISQYII